MKLQGTQVIHFSDFIQSLQNIAGICFITRQEYDDNNKKLCSFSHINKNFGKKWNTILEEAGLVVKRKILEPITQGRKLKDRSKYKIIECLRCDTLFESPDPKLIRICQKCKKEIKLEDEYGY